MDTHLIADLVFMVGGFVFAPSLLFSIKRNVKMPATTSLPTALVLTAFVGCYVLLELYLAAFATTLTAVCWYILYLRRK